MEKSKEKIHRVKFLDKKDGMWYSLTEEPVTREEAEEIYNRHTHYGQIYTTKDEPLFFVIK